MPLSRSKSKNNGQSPANVFQPTSTPRFFPPSHFAASAARSLTGTRPSPVHVSRGESNESNTAILASTMPQFPASSSSSSMDTPAPISSPLYLLTRKLSAARTATSHTTPGLNLTKKANNQKLKDLPALETNLIPSLRDTIDRMTSTSTVLSPVGGFNNKSRPFSPGSALSSPSPVSSVLPVTPARSPRRAPSTAFAISDGNRIRPPSAVMPKLAQPTPPLRLKSALKSPAISNPDSSSQTASPIKLPTRSPSKTVRLAKSFIGKKPVLDPDPPFPFSSPRLHERSRTDPGSGASSIPTRIPPYSRAYHAPSHVPSTIPTSSSTSSTSGYEWDLPPRQLIVTNAIVVPSSSEDSELIRTPADIPRRPDTSPQAPTPSLRQKRLISRGSVGLGLGASFPAAGTGLSRRHPSIPEENPAEDSESAYEDEDEEIDTEPATGVNYPEDRHPTNVQGRLSHVAERTQFEQRRIKTLSALVDVLDLPQPLGDSHDSSEGDYAGQTGYAISSLDDKEILQLAGGPVRSSSLRISGSGRESIASDDSPIHDQELLFEQDPSATATRDHFTPLPQTQPLLTLRRSRPESASSKLRHPSQNSVWSVAHLSTPDVGCEQKSELNEGEECFASETYTLRDTLRQAVVQSREAFGLPPSPEDIRPTESASSVGSAGRWVNEAGELSTGAAAIFGRFGGEASRGQSWIEGKAQTSGSMRSVNSRSSVRLSRQGSSTGSVDDPTARRQGEQRESHFELRNHPLHEQLGDMEAQRQEAIRALCEEEASFVSRLRTTVKLFVNPLRIKDTKLWVAGIPSPVARLFDWLEDLVGLHAQLASMLRAALHSQNTATLRIAETLRTIVPRLEMYQPYVVRVEEAVRIVRDLSRDIESDFGEFVRIQESVNECEGWRLDKLLAEPVNRLVEYPTCFRLLELTPREHVDYLATFSLVQSTELMIRALREVKVREEEHDLVHDILSRIDGLPATLAIPRRERRLLARGRLLRHENPSPYFLATEIKRSSRLFDAVRSRRTPSISSSDSAFTDSSGSPHTPASYDQPVHADSLYAFVFADLLLLASPFPTSSSTLNSHWRLLDDVGVTRVLSVRQSGTTLLLEVLPLDSVRVVLLRFTVPSMSTSGALLNVKDISEKWASAFFRCAVYTRQLLAMPVPAISLSEALASHSGGRLLASRGSEAGDVYSLLAAGLPLPKSPSAQLADLGTGRGGDATQGEREERGWWTVRFREVLREMLGAGIGGLLISGREVAGTSGVGTNLGTGAVDVPGGALGLMTGSEPRYHALHGGTWDAPRLASLASAESLAFGDFPPLGFNLVGLDLV